MSLIFAMLEFKCAHLKFSVSGQSKQANKQANIHMHVRNEVTLVWGLLRLAPMTAQHIVAGFHSLSQDHACSFSSRVCHYLPNSDCITVNREIFVLKNLVL